jgi:8-oxo-dGTP pyrophosphatase MutT (NUDIX family)
LLLGANLLIFFLTSLAFLCAPSIFSSSNEAALRELENEVEVTADDTTTDEAAHVGLLVSVPHRDQL